MAFGVLVSHSAQGGDQREATASNTSTPGMLDAKCQRSLIATATAQQLDYLISKAKRSRRHWNETVRQELTLPADATETAVNGASSDQSSDIETILQGLRQTIADLSDRTNEVWSHYATTAGLWLCPSLSMDAGAKVAFASNDCKRKQLSWLLDLPRPLEQLTVANHVDDRSEEAPLGETSSRADTATAYKAALTAWLRLVKEGQQDRSSISDDDCLSDTGTSPGALTPSSDIDDGLELDMGVDDAPRLSDKDDAPVAAEGISHSIGHTGSHSEGNAQGASDTAGDTTGLPRWQSGMPLYSTVALRRATSV